MEIMGYEIDHAYKDDTGRIKSTKPKGRVNELAEIHHNNTLRRLVIFHRELKDAGYREERISKQVLTDLWMKRWGQNYVTASNYTVTLYEVRT